MNTLRKKLAAAALSVALGVTSAQATLVTAYELITDRDASGSSRSLLRTTSDGTTTWRAGEATILAENQLSSNWGLSTGSMVTWQHTLTGWTLPTYSGFSFLGGLLEISASGMDSWEAGLVRVEQFITLGELTSGYFTNNFTGGSITGFLTDGALTVSVTPWSNPFDSSDTDTFQIYASRLTLSYDTSPLSGGLPDGSDGSVGSLVGPGGIAGVPESNSTLLLVAGASVLLWRFARRKSSGVAREKLS
ncbi:MAG: hypothetical protein ACO3JJ_13605 [Opitutaceae bacterium]